MRRARRVLCYTICWENLTPSSGGIQCSVSCCSRCQMETHRTKAFGRCMYASTFFDWIGAYEIGSNTKVESGLLREGAFEYAFWFFLRRKTEEKFWFWYRLLSVRIVGHLQRVQNGCFRGITCRSKWSRPTFDKPSSRPKQLKKPYVWN